MSITVNAIAREDQGKVRAAACVKKKKYQVLFMVAKTPHQW